MGIRVMHSFQQVEYLQWVFFKANFTLEVISISLFVPFLLSSSSLFTLSGKSLIIPPSVAQVKQLKAVLNKSSDYLQQELMKYRQG